MPIIQVTNLTKQFPKTLAVDDISFTVEKGEIVGFLGPNGAGKSTTIRCMMDFLRPTSGVIKIFGKDARLESKEIKKDLGFLAGEVNLYDSWTGREHIELFRKIRGVETNEDELISLLDYDPSKRVKTLSTGNKQKLGIILALMHSPKLLLLDEPTTGLDPFLQQSVTQLLQKHAENGNTVFLSSHNLTEVERTCDRVLIIKEGKLVELASIDKVKENKLYTVFLHFDGKAPARELLESEDVKVIRKVNNGYNIQVKGDIDKFLKKVSRYQLSDIEITHATLEEIFLEFYK